MLDTSSEIVIYEETILLLGVVVIMVVGFTTICAISAYHHKSC
jgi:hypothetical protein